MQLTIRPTLWSRVRDWRALCRRSGQPGHVVLLGRVAALTLVLSTATALQAVPATIYVDPAADRPQASGAEGDPLGSLRDALERVEPGSETTVVLAAGVYSAERESYPIELPTVARSLRVVGPRSDASQGGAQARFSTADSTNDTLTLRVDPGEGSPLPMTYEFSGLVFDGGRKGLSVVVVSDGILDPIPPVPISVDVSDCTFDGQKFQAIGIVAGSGAVVRATIHDCAFRGGSMYSVDLGAGIDGRLEIDVSRNRLESVGGAGAFPLRAGVSVFVDTNGELSGQIDGNWLLDPTIGIVIATSSKEDAGAIDLEVTNNVIVGNLDGALRGLRHGLQLNVTPGKSLNLQVASNTIANGSGAGVVLQPCDYGEAACSRATVDFRENVVMQLSRGFVDWALTGTAGIDENRAIPECFQFERNGVGTSGGLPVPNSIEISASDFIAVDRGDFRPVATSSLVDAGTEVKTSIAPSVVDADGKCRVVDGDGDSIFRIDIGAFEFSTESTPCADRSMAFLRGDCNTDGRRDISDPITAFDFLFTKPIVPECMDACDSNDDGTLNITDGIHLLSFLFRDGDQPPEPFGVAGFDPTPDPLGCEIE